jgi:hypothetical protein
MKWWQLLWLLDDNIDFLQAVLTEPQWESYREWLTNRDAIRQAQRREILDAIVPDALCLKALAGCRIRFVAEDGALYGGFFETDTNKLSALEAYARYGGLHLVDAVDRGVVQLRQIP